MGKDYDRKFNAGRQSELLFNEELWKSYQSINHLLDVFDDKHEYPHPKINGSLWLDMRKNELNYYDKPHDKMVNVFKNKFRLIDQLLDALPPEDAIYGQLWLNNGVLFYFDGIDWQPVSATTVDSSQLNLAAFDNFFIYCPMLARGNHVADDDYDKALIQYQNYVLDNMLDPKNGEAELSVKPFKYDDKSQWNANIELPLAPATLKEQYLVANINVDRLMKDNDLSTDYEVVNGSTVQYKKADTVGKTVSMIHVNPGKITKVIKRVIKVDKINPNILIKANNTEFYGYVSGNIYGDWLMPVKNLTDVGDYIITPEGINLTYNASQAYDYVLAVTYEFSWIRSSGKVTKTTSNDETTSYYIPRVIAPLNVFVDGYGLEDTYWSYDNLSQTLTIKENTRAQEVSLWHTLNNEYGWIKDYDVRNRGMIRTINKFKDPLIVVNGEILDIGLDNIEVEGNMYFVDGAKRNMSWGVIELFDNTLNESIKTATGIVTDTDATTGDPIIKYDITKIAADEGLVLFVNGLIIKEEDITRDTVNGILSVPNLSLNSTYILLRDKYHNLIDQKDMSAAFYVGRADESLVYMNKKLLCNSTALFTVKTKSEEKVTAAHNEIKAFLIDGTTDKDYQIYSTYDDAWAAVDPAEVKTLQSMFFSYDNTKSAIKLNITYTATDVFDVFAYSFANTIDNPLVVRNIEAHDDDTFKVDGNFEYGTGALSVWLDGVRQYTINENLDGTGFTLPEKFTGRVTYIIEKPEKGQEVACVREILDCNNIQNDTPNVYHTATSLYPGAVTVYVSGLRMPKESWTIIDNNTIMFNDTETMLIGDPKTYPIDNVKRKDGSIVKVPVTVMDKILVEVRQDYTWTENTINWKEANCWDIYFDKYDLPVEILEANDEILIFINGAFTGLRLNIGYLENRDKGSISILSSDVIEAISTDPLYTFLMSDQEKRIAYKEKYGQDYERNINSIITLQWR